MRLRSTLLVIALLGASVPAVSAGTIVYTDLASFQAASSTTNIDFGGFAPVGSYSGGYVELTFGDVTFSNPNPVGVLYVMDADYACCAFPSSVAPATLLKDYPLAGLAYHAEFGSPVTAVGFDTTDGCPPACFPSGGNITVAFPTGSRPRSRRPGC